MASKRDALWLVPYLVMLLVVAAWRLAGPDSPDPLDLSALLLLMGAPIVTPVVAAVVRGGRSVLVLLLSATWVSFVLVYLLIEVTSYLNWIRHGYADMSMIVIGPYAIYLLICSLLAVVAFWVSSVVRPPQHLEPEPD